MNAPINEENYTEKFAFVAPNSWDKILNGIRAADYEFGTNTKFIRLKQLNEADLIEALENVIMTDVDGIITAGAFDTEKMQNVIKKAQNLGIPVVVVDSDIPKSGRNVYVGTNNYEAGVAAGKDLVEITGGNAHIGVVLSELKATNQAERLEGLYETLRTHPDMQIVEVLECHSNYLELAKKVPAMLNGHKEIDTLCFLDGSTGSSLGHILNYQFKAKENFSIVAFDDSDATLDYVAKGIYASTIVQKRYEEGYKAVETLYQIVHGLYDNDEDILYTGVESIRANDVDTYKKGLGEKILWHYY